MEDSTVAVKELKKNAEGHSYCPFLLRRTKIRKNSKQIVKYLVSSNENESQTEEDFLKPIDLQVGKDVSVLGHRFLLCDCDTRTRIYYESILKVPQGEKIVIERIRTARPKIVSSINLILSEFRCRELMRFDKLSGIARIYGIWYT